MEAHRLKFPRQAHVCVYNYPSVAACHCRIQQSHQRTRTAEREHKKSNTATAKQDENYGRQESKEEKDAVEETKEDAKAQATGEEEEAEEATKAGSTQEANIARKGVEIPVSTFCSQGGINVRIPQRLHWHMVTCLYPRKEGKGVMEVIFLEGDNMLHVKSSRASCWPAQKNMMKHVSLLRAT